jgi:electron transport complex protein RnfB
VSDEAEKKQPKDAAEAVDLYTATTIPVRVDVNVKQAVLNLDEAEKILRAADSIALGPCACRNEQRKCDAPIDTCLTLNQDSGNAVETWKGFRHVSADDALAALRTSHEAGLVHLAYRKPGQEGTVFCSCCSCCCWFLNALKRFDYHDAIVEASHVAEQDIDRCIGCGTCVGRCPFAAWSPAQDGGVPSLNLEQCFGCGVCVSACPVGAIAFVPRTATLSAG